MLRPCKSIYGGTQVIPELPPHTVVENALWIPESKGGLASGLFYPSGRVVAEALHYRGIPDPHTPLDSGHFTASRQGVQHAPEGFRYIYIQIVSKHFGHFLLGALSRLWTLPFGERRKLRLLFKELSSIQEMFSIPHISVIWDVLGLTEENFVSFAEGAIFERIEVPGAAFEENSHVHEIYSDVMERLGACLWREPVVKTPARITYLTKQNLHSGIWRMINEVTVTDILIQHGVEIVSPEQLSLPEQVRLWKEGGTFIATSGSALHTSAFVPGRRVIVINNIAEMWSNQVLIDRVSGNDAVYLHDAEGTGYYGGNGEFLGHLVAHNPEELAMDILSWAKKPNLSNPD